MKMQILLLLLLHLFYLVSKIAFCWQLVLEFAKDENIPLGGAQSAEILLGRDMRPSGEFLLEAAKQVGSANFLISFLRTDRIDAKC